MNVTIDGAQQAGYLFHHQGRVGIEPDIINQSKLKQALARQLLAQVRWPVP